MKKNRTITKQPSKKRKQLYTAPFHQRRKKLTAPLALPLAEKEGIKQLVVRKGDTVRIKKGSFRGIEKSDGSSQHFPVQACNCEIINLKNMRDKRRKAIVDRRLPLTEEEMEEIKKT
jgi:large subunit ribosomal protein L24